ncbi:MAG: PD40 domain-containing protein, partial [Bacteroidales bacterium]|nr:PD40 domain-containing protein [Bacteroidales bacterium]
MKRIIGLMIALAVCAQVFAQEEARLLRFPATNGKDIAFTYAGDLWTVPVAGGEAHRLTSHIGQEIFARYSPDGASIAFTGEYDGNREVYLIPSTGGEPKRVTYTATNPRDDLGDRMGPNNIVMTWTPDGSGIMFRNRTEDGFSGKLWTAPAKGGMPTEMPLPEGGWCSWSPDGTKLAYNRVMREFRTWKYYRGGMADDIWIYDPAAKTVKNISNNIAQDIFPMWIGEEIFYASDRDMVMNLFSYNTRTGNTTKVTDFKEYDIKFPSTDGKSIVFENGGYIYRFIPATRKAEKVSITLASDAVYGRAERKDLSGRVTNASLSPDGSRLVVTARGEVFDVPVGKGVTRNITRNSNSNDRSAAWSPDGKSIAWIGDSTGETELYLYDVKSGDVKQLTKGNDTYIRRIMWAPDSKHIYYTDRKNRFVELDPGSGAKRTVMEDPAREFYMVDISPDSKWIAYTRPAENEMDIVYLRSLESGKEYAVTDRWYNSGSPTFSTDGKYLIFTSDRDLNPQYSRIEWNYSFTDMSGVYMAMLAKDTPSPLIGKDPQVKAGEDKPAGAPDKKDKKKGAKDDDKP